MTLRSFLLAKSSSTFRSCLFGASTLLPFSRTLERDWTSGFFSSGESVSNWTRFREQPHDTSLGFSFFSVAIQPAYLPRLPGLGLGTMETMACKGAFCVLPDRPTRRKDALPGLPYQTTEAAVASSHRTGHRWTVQGLRVFRSIRPVFSGVLQIP